jgi:hypothetical protein
VKKPIHQVIVVVCTLLLLTGCGAQCPEGTIRYHADLSTLPMASDSSRPLEPFTIEIRTLLGQKSIVVDDVIQGSICNDDWGGTVYVTCDIDIPAWEENPFFLQDCPVNIEPESTVYVEAHHDKAYYEGCSCHE